MEDQMDNLKKLESLLWQISQQINLHTKHFLANNGLTMARFIALAKMDTDKPITMGELNRRTSLAPGTLTGHIDSLVESGLVKRWRDESDRRAVYLAPTAKGQELLKQIFAFRVSLLEEALADHQDLDLTSLNCDLVDIRHYMQVIPIEH